MGVIKNIAEGWTNYILNRQNEVSASRMEECNKCDYISTKHETNRPDVHCIKCGCTLAAKTRSLESECPIGLWKAIKITDNEQQEINNKKSAGENSSVNT